MANLVYQCPHCQAVNMTHNVVGQSYGKKDGKDRNFLHLSCSKCHLPTSAEVSDSKNTKALSIGHYPLGIAQAGYAIVAIWPAPAKPRIPEHLPDEVARAFKIAERNFLMDDMEDGSAAMYGRALDIGTKMFAPDLPDRMMLAERIRRLAEQQRIAPDLAAWANDARLSRNIALHDIDGTTRDELIAIRGFTEMVLTYLFTLPGMLAARKASAATAGGDAPPTT